MVLVQEHGVHPTAGEFLAAMRDGSKLSREPPTSRLGILKLLAGLYTVPTTRITRTQLGEWIALREMQGWATEVFSGTAIQETMARARASLEHLTMLIASDGSMGTPLLDMGVVMKVLTEIEDGGRDPFPTGFRAIDSRIKSGGLWRGELGLVLAFSGRGKTAFLVDQMCRNILAGRGCFYAVLDNVKREIQERALANLGDISMNDDGMLEDRLRAIQGINDRMPEVVKRVYVEDFKDRQHTSDVIRQYISSYRQQGINIDIVFVDYAAKLRCRTKWNDKRHALEEICEDLRGVAKSEDVVMWTAAQSNRQGLLAGLPTMIHVGEAIGQVYAASLLVAIGMEDALPGWDGARPCTIGVDKNTKGQAGFSFGAKALMDRSKFVEDLEEPVRVMGQRRDGESPGGGPGRGRKKDPEVGPDGKRYRRRGGYNGSRAGYEEAPAKDDQ